jgi:hypothetical protein
LCNQLYFSGIELKETIHLKKIIALCVLTLLISGCSDEVNSKEHAQPVSELDQSISNSIMENFGHRHEFTEEAVELLEFDETTGKWKS